MRNKTTGYVFALLAVSIFAAQDGFTKLLGENNSPAAIIMLRFWVFAGFVSALAARSPGGLRSALSTRHPALQVTRGVLLAATSFVCVLAFKFAGLALSLSIIQITPLLITLLSIPLLKEAVGWRRATAVLVGLFGVTVILNPLGTRLDPSLIFPLAGAVMYALYGIATRAVSYRDSIDVSALYAAVVGALASTIPGIYYWEPIRPTDWPAMFALCVAGTLSHYFLIRAYAVLDAVEIQPLTYLQLVYSIGIATIFFGETITWNMTVGAVLVVVSGLFAIWREYIGQKSNNDVGVSAGITIAKSS